MFSLRFGIYDAATGGVECDNHEESTLVSNGTFSVTLGPVLAACVRDKDIFIEIGVTNDVANRYTTFPARQKIHAATSASTSGSGDFAVFGNLDVVGAVDTGDLTATALNTPGQMTSGSVSTQSVATTSLLTSSLSVSGTTSFPGNSISGGALSANSVASSKLQASPVACVVDTASLGAAGGFRQVAVTLRAGYSRTGGGCDCGSNSPGRLMVRNRPNGTNGWICGCKDHSTGDGNAGTTAYVIGCRLR